MNSYIESVILAYFKNSKDYSFSFLAEMLGQPMSRVNQFIEEMIYRGLLEYKDNLLTLSFKGRIVLQNSDMDYYNNDNQEDTIDQFRHKAWPIDKVYIPQKFMEKVSR